MSTKSVGIIQIRKSELQGKAIREAVRHKCEYIKTYDACFQGIDKVMNEKHLSGPLNTIIYLQFVKEGAVHEYQFESKKTKQLIY